MFKSYVSQTFNETYVQAILSDSETDHISQPYEPIIDDGLPSVSQAQDLLSMSEEADNQFDIFAIITSHLRGLRKLKATPAILKRLMHFTAVIEYVKIRDQLQSRSVGKRSKRPSQRASMIVAARMGKGPFFARQVREHTLYLIRNGQLPPLQTKKRPGGHSLIDNEAVVLTLRRYFALLGVGEITPLLLQKHVNNVIIPLLLLAQPNNTPQTISVQTARSWLRKLGFLRTRAKKGIYIDGHDRPDVIEARNKFLDRVKELEP